MVRRKPRFQVGDIVCVEKCFEQSNDTWVSGIIEITGLNYQTNYTNYHIKTIKGNIRWYSYNSEFLDKEPYIYLIGNVNEDKALRLLYGR